MVLVKKLIVLLLFVNVLLIGAVEVEALYPRNEAENVTRHSLVLRWILRDKNIADALSFSVFFGLSETPVMVTSNLEVEEFLIREKLEPYTKYYWQVEILSRDSGEPIGKSPVFSFTTGNLAPSVPNIITPVNNSNQIPRQNISVKWVQSIDPEGDPIVYTVTLDILRDGNVVSRVFETKTASNEIIIEGPVPHVTENEEYLLMVRASDPYGGFAIAESKFRTKNIAPVLKSLRPSNNATEVPRLNASFSWEFDDPEKDQLIYDFYLFDADERMVYEKKNLSSPEITLEKSISLAPSKKYFWKVTAKDSKDLSIQSSSPLTMFQTAPNKPPKVTLKYPRNEETGVPRTGIIFQWEVEDEDGDEINSCYVKIYSEKSSTRPITLSVRGNNFLEFKEKFAGNTNYTWEVVVYDKYSSEGKSERFSFKTTNNPPSVPTLVTPVNQRIDRTKPIVFEWTNSKDPDGDEVKYVLVLKEEAENKLQGNDLFEIEIKNQNSVVLEPKDFNNKMKGNKAYSWFVKVTDGFDTIESQVATFWTTNENPKMISCDLKGVSRDDVIIAWDGFDREQDDIYLELTVTGPGGSVVIPKIKDKYFNLVELLRKENLLEKINVTPNKKPRTASQKLNGNTDYIIAGRICDDFGGFSEIKTLNFKTKNSVPTPPQLISPLQSTGIVGRKAPVKFVWKESTDADGDKVVYEVEIWRGTKTSEADIIARAQTTGTSLDWIVGKPQLLAGNEIYFWKVKAIDDFGSTSEAEGSFKTDNQSPVFRVGPILEPGATREKAVVSWSVEDPEGDPINVQIKVKNLDHGREEMLNYSDLKTGKVDIVEDLRNTLRLPLLNLLKDGRLPGAAATKLNGNTKFEIEVIVSDIEVLGNNSIRTISTVAGSTLKLTTQNLPPNKPVDSSGSKDKPVSRIGHKLSWSCFDPEDDRVEEFKILLGTSKDLKEAYTFTTKDTFLEVKKLNGKTKYYWKVIATDEFGDSVESDVFEFMTGNEPPKIKEIKMPVPGSTRYDYINPQFSWTCEDPEGDKLTYDFALYEIDTFGLQKTIAKQKLDSPNFIYHGTLDPTAQKYFWMIEVEDEYGDKVLSNVMEFTVKGLGSLVAVEDMNSLKDKIETFIVAKPANYNLVLAEYKHWLTVETNLKNRTHTVTLEPLILSEKSWPYYRIQNIVLVAVILKQLNESKNLFEIGMDFYNNQKNYIANEVKLLYIDTKSNKLLIQNITSTGKNKEKEKEKEIKKEIDKIKPGTSVAVGPGGKVYYIDSSNQLKSVTVTYNDYNYKAENLVKFDSKKDPIFGGPLVDSNGLIYIVTGQGKIYRVNPDKESKNIELIGDLSSILEFRTVKVTPTLSSDSILYLAKGDVLIAFDIVQNQIRWMRQLPAEVRSFVFFKSYLGVPTLQIICEDNKIYYVETSSGNFQNSSWPGILAGERCFAKLLDIEKLNISVKVESPENEASNLEIPVTIRWKIDSNLPDEIKFLYKVKINEIKKDNPSHSEVFIVHDIPDLKYDDPKELKYIPRWYDSDISCIVEAISDEGIRTSTSVKFSVKDTRKPVLLEPQKDSDSVDPRKPLTFKWFARDDRPGGNLKYRLTIELKSIFSWKKVLDHETNNLEYTLDQKLLPGQEYRWKVTAIDKDNEEIESGFWNFKTKKNNPPSVPRLKTKVTYAKDGNTIVFNEPNFTLEWFSSDEDDDEIFYEITVNYGLFGLYEQKYISKSNSCSAEQIESVLNKKLTAGSTLTIKVKAFDRFNGESKYAIFNVWINEGPYDIKPLDPTNGQVFNPGKSVLVLRWDASVKKGDILGYDVYLSDSPNVLSNPVVKNYTSKTLTLQDKGIKLDWGKTYYWKVAVTDSFGKRVESPVWSFKLNKPPQILERIYPYETLFYGSARDASNITFSWKASDPEGDEVFYEVFLGEKSPDTSGSETYNMKKVSPDGLKTTSVTVNTKLKLGQTYYWKVVATDKHGAKSEGPTWAFLVAAQPTLYKIYKPGMVSSNIRCSEWTDGNGNFVEPIINRVGDPRYNEIGVLEIQEDVPIVRVEITGSGCIPPVTLTVNGLTQQVTLFHDTAPYGNQTIVFDIPPSKVVKIYSSYHSESRNYGFRIEEIKLYK